MPDLFSAAEEARRPCSEPLPFDRMKYTSSNFVDLKVRDLFQKYKVDGNNQETINIEIKKVYQKCILYYMKKA